MRITEQTISQTFLANIASNREAIVKLQTQVASGQRVHKPSDDPEGTEAIMRFRSALQRNAQYQKNADDARSMMEQTAIVLDGLATVLQNIKDEVVKASNGTRADALAVNATMLDQALDDIVGLANTSFNGKYIFGGTNTTVAPYTLAADRGSVTPNPALVTERIEFETSESSRQDSNIPGEEAYLGTQMFDEVIRLRDAFSAGQPPTTGDLEAIDALLRHALGTSAKAGAIVNSLDANLTHLQNQELQLRSMLSLEQDADIAETITELKQRELMLDAALNTGARILPKSLVDFLA